MAFKLEDFKEEGSTPKLEDFKLSAPIGAQFNTKTASQNAATYTLLSGGSEEQYQDVKSLVSDVDNREGMVAQHNSIRGAVWDDSTNSLLHTVKSDIPVEQKEAMAVGAEQILSAGSIDDLPPVSTLDTLARQAVIHEAKEPSGNEEASRNTLLDTITEVNKHKREMTKAINSLRLGEDATVGETLTDLGEMMVPFAEWLQIDQLAKEAGTKRIGLLGAQKEALYNKIKELPIDQRAAFAEGIIKIISNNDTVVLPDGNDLMAVETLEKMLVNNDYSNFEKFFDNATSILDVIGVGASIRAIKKLGKGTKVPDSSPVPASADSLQAEAEAFVSKELATDEVLKAEAEGFVPEELATDKALADEAAQFAPKSEPNVDSVFADAVAQDTRTQVSPTSPSQIVKDVNDDSARGMHIRMAEDETGEAAQALYGTTKDEAMAKDILPEPAKNNGNIEHKVEMTAPNTAEPERLRNVRKANGNYQITDTEMEKVLLSVRTNLSSVDGLVLHPASMAVKLNEDGSTTFKALYSGLEAGARSYGEVIEQAEFAFRQYGLSEDNLTVVARRGDEWVPITRKEAEAEQALIGAGADLTPASDYSVQMDFDYRFRPEDLDDITPHIELLTTSPSPVARAIQTLDRIPSQVLPQLGQGSIVQNLLDPSSVIHPRIVGGASVGVDRAISLQNLYVQEFKEFTDAFKSMKKPRRELMTDYIHQANLEGIPLNHTDLYSRGFNHDEVKALEQWRRANDAVWHGTNADMVKTLRAKGVKIAVHNESNTKLFGTPIARGSVKSSNVMFDTNLNKVVTKANDELDELYENGGEVLELTHPIQVDGVMVEKVSVPNNPTGGYVKAIPDDEAVLAYKEGYYPVMYDANHFIEKTYRNAEGELKKRVIASAKTTKERDAALKGLREKDNLGEDPDSVYSARLDRRLNERGDQIFDEGSWSSAVSSGLSSQRVRGARLADAGVGLERVGHAHLKDPLEAVARQIQTLSQRTTMRTYFESTKKRWMANYGKYLELPVDPRTNMVRMPRTVGDIKPKNGAPSRMVADARTNFNYIHSLENGYINWVDESWRGTMHLIADRLGELGWGKGESLSYDLSKTSPTQKAKTLAFKMFISGNPVRQAVLQRGQMLMVGSRNPSYAARMPKDLIGIDMVRGGMIKSGKYADLYKEIKDAGILDAVDAHTLIRDDLLVLADVSAAQKIKGLVKAPLDAAQKIGFDFAEQDVLVSAWLSERDRALRAGKDITSQRVKDEILSEARSFTLQMNRAGEMPYSQNTIGMAAQFFSFQHKALLQGITNSSLSAREKAQVLAYTTAMFGIGATPLAIGWRQITKGDEPNPLYDQIEAGLVDTTLNWTLSQLSGESQAIDFGDLAPSEVYGTGQVLMSMLDFNLSGMITESPSGSLLFGQNPRVQDAFKTALKYFHAPSNYSDPELAVTGADVFEAHMRLFSGVSNYYKARYAMQMRQKMSSSGTITDEEITAVEATATLFGFSTKDEVGKREVYSKLYGDSESLKGDVRLWYQEMKRHLARRDIPAAEAELVDNVLREAWSVFGESRPDAVTEVRNLIQRDAKSGDYKFIRGLVKQMGMTTDREMWDMIRLLPEGKTRDYISDTMKAREGSLDGES